MSETKTKPTEDMGAARLQFLLSVERLLNAAEQTKQDRDRLLRLLEQQEATNA